MFWWEKYKFKDDYDNVEDILCPHCNNSVGFDSDYYEELISYWGEDNLREYDCESCSKKFFVKEVVNRHWGVYKPKELTQ